MRYLFIVTLITLLTSCAHKKNRVIANNNNSCNNIENQKINTSGSSDVGTLENPYQPIDSFAVDHKKYYGVKLAVGPVDGIDENLINKVTKLMIKDISTSVCGAEIFPKEITPDGVPKKQKIHNNFKQASIYKYISKSDNKLKAFTVTVFVNDKYAAFIQNRYSDIKSMVESGGPTSDLVNALKPLGSSTIGGGFWLIH